MGAQAVQTAIDSGDLRPADPESALENSASKLTDTLGKVVDFVFDKMDALAEVCTHMNKALMSVSEYRVPKPASPLREYRMEGVLIPVQGKAIIIPSIHANSRVI